MDSHKLTAHGRKASPAIHMGAMAWPFGNFGTTEAQKAQFLILGIGIVTAVVLMWAWFAWKKHRASKAARTQHASAMLDMMRSLAAQRSRMDIFPANRKKNSLDNMFSGFCSGCGEDLIRLNVALKPNVTEWRHPSVDVFFQTAENGNAAFYSFRAEVKEATVNGARLLAALTLPVKLNRGQKRDFFRITPPSSVVQAMALWPMDAELARLETIHGNALGKPVYGFKPGKLSQIILEDISAGGMRLGFESAHYRSLGRAHAVGDRFIVLLALTNASGEDAQQYWFKCLCVHTDQSVGRTEPVAGLQFQAWCATERLTDELAWEPPGDGGDVQPLNTWLTRYVRDRKAENDGDGRGKRGRQPDS